MFAGIKASITNSVINNTLRGIAQNPDIQATAAGSGLALVIAAQVNYGALFFNHDWNQAGILLAAIGAWLLGLVANKNTVAKHVIEAMVSRLAALEAEAEKTAKGKAA